MQVSHSLNLQATFKNATQQKTQPAGSFSLEKQKEKQGKPGKQEDRSFDLTWQASQATAKFLLCFELPPGLVL